MLARKLLSPRPAFFLLGAGLLAYVGCSSSGDSAVAVTHPTMIEVAPDSFLGGVPCSSHDGGLKSYVATLFDLEYSSGGAPSDEMNDEGNAGDDSTLDQVQLPSSLPTPCSTSVGFGYVVPGRHYQVRIDGYDTGELTPRAIGSREVVTDDQVLATPRWRAACYRAIAVSSTVVRADHCDKPFEPPAGAPTTGSLRVPLGSLLGDLNCGSETDQVDHFTVTSGSATQTVACSADAEVVFGDLDPKQPATAFVTAFSTQSAWPFAATSCNAEAVADARVDAQCGALTKQGILRVELPAALELLGLSCDKTKVGAIELSVGDGNKKTLLPPDCLRAFDQAYPATDRASVELTAFEPEHPTAKLGSVTCYGQVTPAALTVAVCEKKSAE